MPIMSAISDLPEDMQDRAMAVIREEMQRAYNKKGLDGLEFFRGAAIAHVAGATVVTAHDFGNKFVEDAYIFPMSTNGVFKHDQWLCTVEYANGDGRVDTGKEPLPALVKLACRYLGGSIGESIFAHGHHRPETCFDSVIVGQLICQSIGSRMGKDGETIYRLVSVRVMEILKHNEKLVQKIIRQLDCSERIPTWKLHTLLGEVLPIYDDPIKFFLEP